MGSEMCIRDSTCNPAAFTVIPNGAEIPEHPAGLRERRHHTHEWLRRYHRTGPLGQSYEHLGLFVGSWHPPNLDAVWLLTEIAAENNSTIIFPLPIELLKSFFPNSAQNK